MHTFGMWFRYSKISGIIFGESCKQVTAKYSWSFLSSFDEHSGVYFALNSMLIVNYSTLHRNRVKKPYQWKLCTRGYKNTFINANKSTDVAGFANDCRAVNRRNGECAGNNARYTFKNDTVNLLSTKRISPNAEVFVPCGMDFWRKAVERGWCMHASFEDETF